MSSHILYMNCRVNFFSFVRTDSFVIIRKLDSLYPTGYSLWFIIIQIFVRLRKNRKKDSLFPVVEVSLQVAYSLRKESMENRRMKNRELCEKEVRQC
jgi:hypothetical protein